MADDSQGWENSTTLEKVPDSRCATPYATNFSLLPEPQVDITYEDGAVQFSVEGSYVRGAALYVGLVPYGESQNPELANGAKYPEGLVDGPSSWPLDASDLCAFESETCSLYKVAEASYPLSNGIWDRAVTSCLDVSYTANRTFGQLLNLSRENCSSPFFFTSARNGAFSVNGVLYVAYIGGTDAEVAEWSYPFYAENKISIASCSEDMDVVLQVTKGYSVASVSLPVGTHVYCNLSASIATLSGNGSTGEREPLTSTKFTCDCDFGCSNMENSYAVELPFSFGEDPIRQRMVYLDFESRTCDEDCAEGEPVQFYFVVQESYGVTSLGGSRGLRARLMRIVQLDNPDPSGGVQTVQVRLDGDGITCSEEEVARGVCRAAVAPSFRKVVLYKGDGSEVLLYDVSAMQNCSSDYDVQTDGPKGNLRFSMPSSMVLLGNGVSTSPSGSLKGTQADFVKVWESSGSSGSLSLTDLLLQPFYASPAVEEQRKLRTCTNVTFGGCDFPGAGCTVPNTTEPNTTEPNTTEPNTTEPNTTEPNTTEPNTTLPNGTENNTDNGTDGNGTNGEKGAFGHRVSRALPLGLATLVAALVLMLW